jgi:hypothetical protein
MTLYALCVYPFLHTLEDRLTGVSIGERGQRILVLAYADDITVFLSNVEDIEKVHHAIRIYEQATGAISTPINPERSLWVVGRNRLRHWELGAGTNSLRPQLEPRSPGTISTSLPLSEIMVAGRGLTTADPPHPAADVDLHVIYMERGHLSCSQHDPPATEKQRWMGFTRHSPKMSGTPSWENVNICRTEGLRDRAFLGKWNITDAVENTPNISKIPSKLVHVRQYAPEIAYESVLRTNKTMRKLRHLELYVTIQRGAT